MKTIAQQLNIKDFPFIIKDKNGRVLYHEDGAGLWCKYERDKNGNELYYEDINGIIEDNRPKTCNGKIVEIDVKIVEIDGKKYKLTEL